MPRLAAARKSKPAAKKRPRTARQPKPSAPPASSREWTRLTRLMLFVLAASAAWTIASRLPDSAPPPNAAPPSPLEGYAAPDFSLEALDGSRLTLSDLRGHPVVVNLWASWCLPCRTEMPAFERVHRSYADRGVVILGVNLTAQDSEADARQFVEEFGLTFPILLDRDGTVSRLYQVLGLPSTYFIDREGVIRSVVIGGPLSEAAMRARIEELLEDS